MKDSFLVYNFVSDYKATCWCLKSTLDNLRRSPIFVRINLCSRHLFLARSQELFFAQGQKLFSSTCFVYCSDMFVRLCLNWPLSLVNACQSNASVRLDDFLVS